MCCLHQFEYLEKSRLIKTADWILTAPRHLFNGKTIKCYRLGQESATFIESRPYSGKFIKTIIKTASVAGTFLMSPLIIPALIIKKCDDRENKISNRYCRRSPKDNFWKEHLLSNDLVTRLTAKMIMKMTGMDDLTLSMQIHGDKILRKIAPWRYEGGHSLVVADLMLKKVAPLKKYSDPDVSLACQKAKAALKNMVDISKKMALITFCNIFSINSLLNSEKRLRNLAEDVSDDLMHMQNNDVFMIPLNFYTPTQGFRNMTTTVKRIDKNEYEWHIFRADIGAENKHFMVDENKISEIIVKGLTAKQITDKHFLKKILGYGTARKQDQGERFFKFLKKFEIAHANVIIINGITKKKIPFSDTLSHKSLNFALKELMGGVTYKKFMFLLKFDDLFQLKEKVEKDQFADHKKKRDVKMLIPFAEDKIKSRYKKIKKNLSKETLISLLIKK